MSNYGNFCALVEAEVAAVREQHSQYGRPVPEPEPERYISLLELISQVLTRLERKLVDLLQKEELDFRVNFEKSKTCPEAYRDCEPTATIESVFRLVSEYSSSFGKAFLPGASVNLWMCLEDLESVEESERLYPRKGETVVRRPGLLASVVAERLAYLRGTLTRPTSESGLESHAVYVEHAYAAEGTLRKGVSGRYAVHNSQYAKEFFTHAVTANFAPCMLWEQYCRWVVGLSGTQLNRFDWRRGQRECDQLAMDNSELDKARAHVAAILEVEREAEWERLCWEEEAIDSHERRAWARGHELADTETRYLGRGRGRRVSRRGKRRVL